MNKFGIILFYFFFLFLGKINAQAPIQSVQRQEIDAKRMDSNPMSDDALPRSREFIRIDPTYYVGYMYEGLYKENHAADFLGFKNAIEPLKKALTLLEKDYAKQLKTRTSSLIEYYPVYKFQLDYSIIAIELAESYSNIDEPQEAFKIAEKVKKFNFQRDYYFNPYIQMAWIVHRNRFYKTDKYSFLKNTIPENEALANTYLDDALKKIQRDKITNRQIYQPGYEKQDIDGVYHYKAILYSYALNIDSADKYYALLMKSPIPSYNNYGTFLSITGRFGEAYQTYQKASQQETGDKRLKEWAYYSSILDIYKGKPLVAEAKMKDMIKAVGSTPGFGWYNIALARAETYSGDLKNSQRHIEKAAGFKELHIGTTLGQTHYDFSISMVKLMNKIMEIQQIKFENKGWWYSFSDLFTVIKLTTQKYLLEYLIVNQLASNPERDKVIYPLFSTESTVSWDEIWYLIRDFSSSFFYKEFQNELKTDKRPLIKKYFQLYLAKLEMKKGDYKKAEIMLKSILSNPEIDRTYEQLFIARCFEALNKCADEQDETNLSALSANSFYETYPQLVPFSNSEINMHLQAFGNVDKKMVKQLKKSKVNWISDPNIPAPEVTLEFKNEKGKKSVVYTVTKQNGEELVKRQEFFYKDAEKDGKNLLMRLFNISL